MILRPRREIVIGPLLLDRASLAALVQLDGHRYTQERQSGTNRRGAGSSRGPFERGRHDQASGSAAGVKYAYRVPEQPRCGQGKPGGPARHQQRAERGEHGRRKARTTPAGLPLCGPA